MSAFSSFKKTGGPVAVDPRTKPGLQGQSLISSGLADLDALLGGGLPLGSITLILEDGYSRLHETFLQYFLAEGAASSQSILLAWGDLSDIPELGSWLPAKSSPKDEKQVENEEDNDAGLRIAWQYRRYINKPESNSTEPRTPSQQRQAQASASKPKKPRAWATTFDLRKFMGSVASCAHRSVRLPINSEAGESLPQVLQGACTSFLSEVQTSMGASGSTFHAATSSDVPRASISPTAPKAPLPPRRPEAIGRIAVASLGLSTSSQSSDCITALMVLRGLVRDQSAAAVVTVPAGTLSPHQLIKLEHMADTVLALRTVPSDADLVAAVEDGSSIAGLLEVKRLPLGAGLQPLAIDDSSLFLVRNLRRRLSVKPVDIDPTFDLEARSNNQPLSTGLSELTF